MSENENEQTPAEMEAARSLAVFLPQIEDGEFNHDASDAFRDLVAAMRDHAANTSSTAKGKFAIQIDLLLVDGVVEVRASFKATAPKAPRARSVFWATDGNNLSPENPRQIPMFSRRVVEVSSTRRSV